MALFSVACLVPVSASTHTHTRAQQPLEARSLSHVLAGSEQERGSRGCWGGGQQLCAWRGGGGGTELEAGRLLPGEVILICVSSEVVNSLVSFSSATSHSLLLCPFCLCRGGV